jgi:periplasmic protein TonB
MLLPSRQNELPLWCGWMVGASTLMTLWASSAAAQRSLTSPANRPLDGAPEAPPAPDGPKVQDCVPECVPAATVEDACAEATPPDGRAQYAQTIHAQIHRCCRYPHGCASASGSVMVSFAISGGGALTESGVSQSSGDCELDRIALESVRSAGLFPPTPTGAEMRFSAPFQFR